MSTSSSFVTVFPVDKVIDGTPSKADKSPPTAKDSASSAMVASGAFGSIVERSMDGAKYSAITSSIPSPKAFTSNLPPFEDSVLPTADAVLAKTLLADFTPILDARLTADGV